MQIMMHFIDIVYTQSAICLISQHLQKKHDVHCEDNTGGEGQIASI